MSVYQLLKGLTRERYPDVSRTFLSLSSSDDNDNTRAAVANNTSMSTRSRLARQSQQQQQPPQQWIIQQFDHDALGNVMPLPTRTYQVTAPANASDAAILGVLQGDGTNSTYRYNNNNRPSPQAGRAAWGELFKSLFITVLTGVLIAVLANLIVNWLKRWRDQDRIEYEKAATQYLYRQMANESATAAAIAAARRQQQA